jgi:NADH-quinone oxidoreductase E subunit
MITADVDEILERHPQARRDSLIPILQEVQEKHGYLSRESMQRIGQHLNLPVSKVYGVATFYNQFRFHPNGQFHIQVCRGTACHVKGSKKVLDTLVEMLKIAPGETTRDRMFSLEVVACIGACGLAPVICINGDFIAKVTPDKLNKVIKDCRRKANANAEASAE